MGLTQSKSKLVNINPNVCDKKCRDKKELKKLNSQKNINTIFKNTISKKISDIDYKINMIKYGENRMDEIRIKNENDKLYRDINKQNMLNKQLMDELNTRINLSLKQYKFYTKNNIVLTDLDKKIKELDNLLKKKNVDNRKNIRMSENLEKDYLVAKKKLEYKKKTCLFLFLLIIGLIALIVYLKKKKV